MAMLVALLTFFVAVALCLLVWMFVSADKGQETVRRRMDSVRKAERRGPLSLGTSLVRDELLSSVPPLHRLLIRFKWSSKLHDYVLQAGMKTKPAKIVLIMAVIGFAGYYVISSFIHNFLGAFVLSVGLACVPLLYIGWKRSAGLGSSKNTSPRPWTC